jgi:tRNA-splicing ligase RtcB
MELAGDFAAANHEVIHNRITQATGLTSIATVENHHNFAWREKANDKEIVVHRKGATPAGKGVLGIIPGSMGDPGFVVKGKGRAESINSASHGAGRQMSRRQANRTITHEEQLKYLEKLNVELIGGGLDEAAQAYKRIEEVMAAQEDLVDIIGKFEPKIVRMADDGSSED